MTVLTMEQTTLDLIWTMVITIRKEVLNYAKRNVRPRLDVNFGVGILVRDYSFVTQSIKFFDV